MSQLFSEIQSALNLHTLHECVSQMINKQVNNLHDWKIESIQSVSLNFTTEGIFRIYGTFNDQGSSIPWSLILKIIRTEHSDKDDPQHHNYWKREALVNQSQLLSHLPDFIYTPQCYKVEEKANGSIWIWMEEIKEENNKIWSEENLAFIARHLGMFNGAYFSSKTLPEYSWICRNWLHSWVNSCKKYSINTMTYYPTIQGFASLRNIYHSYLHLNENIHKHLHAINKLPRVLAHQDLSKQNIFIHRGLTLIDWQFLSISGLGEDLGKLYGIALSQQDIPIEKAEYFQDLLFTNYIEGLQDTGWKGEIVLPRYGFCTSFALRSNWEVPKLMKLASSSIIESDNIDNHSIKLLTDITALQMRAGNEAERLYNKVINTEINIPQ